MREFIRSGAVSPHSMTAGRFRLSGRLSWRDPDIEATLVLSQPDVDPDLWDEFARSAEHSYRKHGVEGAPGGGAPRHGFDPFNVFAGDRRGRRMLAGLRAKGPLRSADDLHAMVE